MEAPDGWSIYDSLMSISVQKKGNMLRSYQGCFTTKMSCKSIVYHFMAFYEKMIVNRGKVKIKRNKGRVAVVSATNLDYLLLVNCQLIKR